MKIRMHSLYRHFMSYWAQPFENGIDCYNDEFCLNGVIAPNSIALLVEPRSIQPWVYEWMERNYRQFRYVFTHDDRLLEICDNAKMIAYGEVWGWSDEPKTKGISLISSDKEMCELHRTRKHLAITLQDKVDCFGTFNGGSRVDTYTAHAPYRFAIVIENYIDDYWFTEKICNCFSNKVIPIYVGARKIGDFFNPKGILQTEDWRGIIDWVNCMSPDDLIAKYEKCKDAVDDNYIRVKEYADFETWFMNKYGDILNDLYSETQGL